MSPKDLIFNSASKVGSDVYCSVENETVEIFQLSGKALPTLLLSYSQ